MPVVELKEPRTLSINLTIERLSALSGPVGRSHRPQQKINRQEQITAPTDIREELTYSGSLEGRGPNEGQISRTDSDFKQNAEREVKFRREVPRSSLGELKTIQVVLKIEP